MPPPLLSYVPISPLQVSTRSDIYSASIMVGEMVSQERPWLHMLEGQIIYHVVFQKERPDLSPRCPPELRELLEQCQDQMPSKRPDASKVLARLQQMRQQADAAGASGA